METLTLKSETQTSSGVKKQVSVSNITLDKVSVSGEFQKPGTLTAQIRQLVKTISSYPSKKTGSDMQANIFSTEEFGFGTQDFESIENRVAFLLVPEGTTEDAVKAKLEAANKASACIYRVLSNEPILDENQKYAIAAALRTKEMFANTQVVRYPDTEDNRVKGVAGKIWTDPQGHVQYRRTFFWNSSKADIDLRGGKSAYFSTPEINEELEKDMAMKGQSL